MDSQLNQKMAAMHMTEHEDAINRVQYLESEMERLNRELKDRPATKNQEDGEELTLARKTIAELQDGLAKSNALVKEAIMQSDTQSARADVNEKDVDNRKRPPPSPTNTEENNGNGEHRSNEKRIKTAE